MIESLLVIALAMLLAILLILVFVLRRKVGIDLSPVQAAFKSVEESYNRNERAVREEIAGNRTELTNSLKGVGDTLNKQLLALTQTNDQKLTAMRETVEQRLQLIQTDGAKKIDEVRQDSLNNARSLREQVATTLKGFNDALVTSVSEIGKLQKSQLDVFAERLNRLTETTEQKFGQMRESVEQKLAAMGEDSGKRLDQSRQEATISGQTLREEVGNSLKGVSDSMVKTLSELGGNQRSQLGNVVEQLTKLTDTNDKKLEAQRTAVDERLKFIQEDGSKSAQQLREEVSSTLKGFNDSVLKGMTGMSEAQQKQMDAFSVQLGILVESNAQKLDSLKQAVEEKLKGIQEDNAKQLEQMRQTVDEKLQGTLEKRLGESFKQVSERLEAVHKGLGEMQVLATGVGDLKKVLTNVKTRGTWGEVQLGAMLEQVLLPDQYSTNVPTKDGGERVEFAIKLPGRGDDKADVVWLPIDAKFPAEDYQRLVDAQERSDADAAEAASKQLEIRIKACAADICSKYLNPPKTTDFAILFLPTEGLFAEVVRRTGLADFVQRECRVVIAGPTTLWSILNSLQMGFKTLVIQERSSEVWKLLAAVKTEWGKYGDVLGKVQKKLQEASNTIDDAERRTRVIGRKLRGVQELPAADADAVLLLGTDGSDGELEEPLEQ